MFDIGFTELVVIAVVALIVLGPERLPKAARTMGHLFGRLQRYVNDVKADINREMELDELRKVQQQVKDAATDFEQSMNKALDGAQAGVKSVENELNSAGQPAPALAEAGSPAPAEVPAAAAPPAATEAAPLVAEPPPERVETRQASLPGFDRI
ncbi:MAG: twin-arginine translocase subunit TatB [Burkholderiales bacterium]|nr:twin-arginine translocase subunit TatB [Burkholderiales bacterium]